MMMLRFLSSTALAATVAAVVLAPSAMAESTTVQPAMTPEMQQTIQNINAMLGNPLGLPQSTTTTPAKTTTTKTTVKTPEKTTTTTTTTATTTTPATPATTPAETSTIDLAALSKDELIAQNKELQEEIGEWKAAQEAEETARLDALNDQLTYLNEQLKLVEAKRNYVQDQIADLEETNGETK